MQFCRERFPAVSNFRNDAFHGVCCLFKESTHLVDIDTGSESKEKLLTPEFYGSIICYDIRTEFRIWNQNFPAVDRFERRPHHGDTGDGSFDPIDDDVIAGVDVVLRENDDAVCEVGDDILETEADSQEGRRDDRSESGQRKAEDIDDKEGEEDGQEETNGSHQETDDGCVDLSLFFVVFRPYPSRFAQGFFQQVGDELDQVDADDQDDDGEDDAKKQGGSVNGEKLDDLIAKILPKPRIGRRGGRTCA